MWFIADKLFHSVLSSWILGCMGLACLVTQLSGLGDPEAVLAAA